MITFSPFESQGIILTFNNPFILLVSYSIIHNSSGLSKNYPKGPNRIEAIPIILGSGGSQKGSS